MQLRFATAVLAVAAASCAELRHADTTDGGGAGGGGDATTPGTSDGGSGESDASTTADAGGDATVSGPKYYDDVQKALQAKRVPGPTTAQGSNGYCTPKYLVWKDSDGTLHSWAGKTQARIDYGFKQPVARSYFVPSDTLIAVDVPPTYAQVNVHDTTAPNTLVDSIPYAFHVVAASNGIIRLDQRVNDVDLGGTKVRRWNRATKQIEDISTVLPTKQPPSSFVNDVLVIPGDVTIPFALYRVDVVAKTTGSVTFDGGIALQQTEQAQDGLVVAYVRNGGAGAALRVYKNNLDDTASRFELGDEVANRAAYFADSPGPLEHKFLARIATWKRKVLYASAYGIWSYDLPTGALAPVQLVANKQSGVPDFMCVLRDENILVYRMTNDSVGQVWAVSLPAVLP